LDTQPAQPDQFGAKPIAALAPVMITHVTPAYHAPSRKIVKSLRLSLFTSKREIMHRDLMHINCDLHDIPMRRSRMSIVMHAPLNAKDNAPLFGISYATPTASHPRSKIN
jgi:hypothetical protein